MNYFKKTAICILSLSMLSLVACGEGDKADISTTNKSDTQEIEIVNSNSQNEEDTKEENTVDTTATDEKIEESEENEVENPSELKSSDVETEPSPNLEENNYKSVLLGEKDFNCIALENKSLNISEIGQAVTDDDSVTISVTKFAIIDIDGDGETETVLWIQINGVSDYGFEVLRYQNGEIYGYTLQYREFMNLKTDGTFTFSNGAADFGIGKMTFSSTEYSINNLAYSQSEYDSNNNLTVQYFVNNESCSEDEFNNIINGQEQKIDVKWYDLSDDNINVVFDTP